MSDFYVTIKLLETSIAFLRGFFIQKKNKINTCFFLGDEIK